MKDWSSFIIGLGSGLFLSALLAVCGILSGEKKAKHQQVEQQLSQIIPATDSDWSAPMTIIPSPPHPQWVILQYRTNLLTREIKARIIAHGSPRGLMEPEIVIAEK